MSPQLCPALPPDPPKLRDDGTTQTDTSAPPQPERGQEVPLENYKGKVVLVVNTASKCSFTPQYAGLESLYTKLKASHPDEFVILGFPSNQFNAQEPGSDDDIQNFCQINYGVSFPIMKKIDVNGDGAAPLYQWLKEEKPGLMGFRRIKWNFEKFLIGRDGAVKGRWASTTKPESLEAPILAELGQPKPESTESPAAGEEKH